VEIHPLHTNHAKVSEQAPQLKSRGVVISTDNANVSTRPKSVRQPH